MSEALTCPFCNAVVPASGHAERMICSRCGESFAAAGRAVTAAMPIAAQAAARRSASPIVFVLGGLLVLGVAGAYLLGVFPKSSKTPKGATVSHSVVKPTELAGLGYLPENCEAIIGLQMPAFLEKMGPEAAQDPVEALNRMGFPPSFAESVESATGVGLINVEQLVVGISFEKGAFPPQIFVVVHTREPYDIETVVRRRKGTSLKQDKRTLHAVKAEKSQEVLLWSPSDRVLVGALLKRDFEAIPMQPRTGTSHLKASVVRLMNERIAVDASFWMAASSDQWGKYMRPYTWLPGSPWTGRDDLIGPADRLRDVTISVPQDAEKSVSVRIDCRNADGAAKLRAAYQQRFSNEEIHVGGESETVTLETEFDPKRVGSMLSRLIGDKK